MTLSRGFTLKRCACSMTGVCPFVIITPSPGGDDTDILIVSDEDAISGDEYKLHSVALAALWDAIGEDGV